MQNTVVKYSIIFLFLLVYINRGLFITPYEIENQGNDEINSVIEWITQLITGESNDIDEDGDLQTDCHCVEISHHDFSQQLAHSIELANLFSKDIAKNRFSNNENFRIQVFCSQIEQPPEV